MLAIFHAIMFVFATYSVADYSGQVTISDEHQLVSNHRDDSIYPMAGQCKPGAQAERVDHIAASKVDYEGLNPAGFQLLNWNVYKGSRESWRDDFQRLSRGSDIVALQEAQLHKEFQDGLEESHLQWDLTTAFLFGEAETGVLTGSGIRPGLPCSLHAEEPLFSIPKSAIVTEYHIQGADETLLVANIHMINFSFSTSEYQQQIRELVNVVRDHEGPMIITGDFNTWNQSRIDIIDEMASSLMMSAVEYDDDQRLTVFRNPVDHVYFRGLEILHANTERVKSSDHNPMMVKFKVASL